MTDQKDIIKNISTIYDSNSSLRVLKDFERVLDELNLYVYKNWEDGELVKGPEISRHWVECSFMWPEKDMPDPMGGKRLLEYNCKVSYTQSIFKEPRKVEKQSDFRPMSKKGKMDEHPIWIVTIKMPKKLMFDIFKGSVRGKKENDIDLESLYQNTDVEQNTGMAAPAGAAPLPPPGDVTDATAAV
jgi:hypothetical protein